MSVEDLRVSTELPSWNAAGASLAIGQDVEALGSQLGEELGAPTATIENDGDASVTDEATDLVEQRRQHLDQPGIGLGGHDEEWLAVSVVDPVVGRGRHRDPHPRHVRLRQRAVPVIHADMAVDVQEAHRVAAIGHPQLGEPTTELDGATESRETGELAEQGLDLRRTVEAEEPAQVRRRVLLERLWALDAQQREEHERNDGGAQPVEGWTDRAVDLAGDGENAGPDDRGNGQEDPSAGNMLPVAEQRRGVVEQPEGGEETVTAAVGGVGVERDDQRLVVGGRRQSGQGLFDGRNLRSGQVWVRRRIAVRGRLLDGCDLRSGQVWVRSQGRLLQRERDLLAALRSPSQTHKLLADCIFGDAEATRDLAGRHTLGFQLAHEATARPLDSRPALGKAACASQRGQAALLEPALVPTNRA